jgi:mRNA interferase MazF
MRSIHKPSNAGKRHPYVPARGDVVWLDFNPQTGHEQAGRRPALVLSPAAYNGLVGLGVFCPITNQSKGYPFEVTVPKGSPVTGVVLCDQLKSLDWRKRNAAYKGKLPDGLVHEVLETAMSLLDPSEDVIEKGDS